MHLPEAAVPLLLKLFRANRAFVTESGARARIADRALRPTRFAPPARLRRDVRVERVEPSGLPASNWPVYAVRPADAAEPDALPVVVYVHGGGWVHEISPVHWRLIAQLAAEIRAEILVPIYPLVPFGHATEARDGVSALVRAALERTPHVALAGDSAGGQIALSAALDLRDAGAALAHTALISPALDLTWSNPRIPEVQPSDPWLAVPGGQVLAAAWRGETALDAPEVSPMFGALSGLAPLTLFSGTRDVLNPDAHVFVQRARAAGVSVALHEAPGRVHVYPLLPTRSGRAARGALVAALTRALANN